MTIQVNIAEAKAKLSELIARAEAGETVVLARNGKEVARIVASSPGPRPKRKLGVWDHLNLRPRDETFFDPDPELEALLEAPISPPE